MTKNQVKNMLNDYEGVKMRSNFVKNTSADYANEYAYKTYYFLSEAITVLPTELKELVEKIYIEKMSIRGCEKELHMSRNTILKLLNKAYDMMAFCEISSGSNM